MFKIVVLLGVIANWAFGIWALFLNPHTLLATFGLGDIGNTTWLYNYSILLMILSLFYIPAAIDPFRYRANAWLLILGRLVPTSTFVLGVAMGFMPVGFLRLALGDGTFGLIELFLLTRLFASETAA
jgi:hypothetical protein